MIYHSDKEIDNKLLALAIPERPQILAITHCSIKSYDH